MSYRPKELSMIYLYIDLIVIYFNTDKKNVTCFDDLLDSIGEFGPWQRVIFVLISMADVIGAMAMLLPVFTGDTPRWSCMQHEAANSSQQMNGTWPKTCRFNMSQCSDIEFHDEFTSIVSEVIISMSC